MGQRLAGKRTLVTGAGQGIGRAIVEAFAAEGADVLAASRTDAKMDDLPAQYPTVRTVALDVADPAAVQAATAAAGPVDVLVNCAGWVADGTILDHTPDDWARSWDVNVMGCVHLIRALLPGMIERGSGSIVNVASVASSVTGVKRRTAYGTTKAAVIGLTKAVARDFIGDGIRCNALCPGTTDSPSLQERMQATPDPQATRAEFVARQPMGRLGRVEEMAAAAVWMASDESGFLTGQVIAVDGGQTL